MSNQSCDGFCAAPWWRARAAALRVAVVPRGSRVETCDLGEEGGGQAGGRLGAQTQPRGHYTTGDGHLPCPRWGWPLRWAWSQ